MGEKKRNQERQKARRRQSVALLLLLAFSLTYLLPQPATAQTGVDLVVHKLCNLFELNPSLLKTKEGEQYMDYQPELRAEQFQSTGENKVVPLAVPGAFSLFSLSDELVQTLSEDSRQEGVAKIYGRWIPELINAYLAEEGIPKANVRPEDFTTPELLRARLEALIKQSKQAELTAVLTRYLKEASELKLKEAPACMKQLLQEKLLYELARYSDQNDQRMVLISEKPESDQSNENAYEAYAFRGLEKNQHYLIIDRTGFALDSKELHALPSLVLKDFLRSYGEKEINLFPKPFPCTLEEEPEEPEKPSVKILKLDKKDGKPLKGARFVLEGVRLKGDKFETTGVRHEAESDAAGVAEFRQIEAGDYRVLELVPPPGYQRVGEIRLPNGHAADPSVLRVEAGKPAKLYRFSVYNELLPPGTTTTTSTSPSVTLPSSNPPAKPPSGGNPPTQNPGTVPSTGESGMLLEKILSLLLLLAAMGLAVEVKRRMRRQEEGTEAEQ